MKLWEGRFEKPTAKTADEFNDSLPFDKKLWKEDITASVAHAKMLGACGIIPDDDCQKIIKGLEDIYSDIADGKLEIAGAEDVHSLRQGSINSRICRS